MEDEEEKKSHKRRKTSLDITQMKEREKDIQKKADEIMDLWEQNINDYSEYLTAFGRVPQLYSGTLANRFFPLLCTTFPFFFMKWDGSDKEREMIKSFPKILNWYWEEFEEKPLSFWEELLPKIYDFICLQYHLQ